jgi:predicted negative regulator of RcsB-dependent stress response
LAATAADAGNLGEAEKQFRAVADSGNQNYASLAKLSLANIYQAQGKQSEGENLLRSLVDKPTAFVSKEQATIALARYLAGKNPAEARKILEPLRTERGPVSRTALAALSEIPQK